MDNIVLAESIVHKGYNFFHSPFSVPAVVIGISFKKKR